MNISLKSGLQFCNYHIFGIVNFSFTAIFLFTINRFSVNFPYNDDYWAIIETVRLWEQNHNFLELFTLHNEHRIFICRLFALLQYKVQGEINFKTLILISCLSIPLMSFLLYKIAKNYAKVSNDWLLIPIPLALNTYFYNGASLWAMCGLQHMWTLVLAIAGVYFIKKENLMHWLAYPVCAFATFSSGGGFFILISILILLFVDNTKISKKISWITFSIFLIILYFSGPRPATATGLIQVVTDHYIIVFFNNISFYASAIDMGMDYHVLVKAIVFSTSLCVLLLYTFFTRQNGYNQSVQIVLIIFIMLNGLASSITRFQDFGLYGAIAHRYKIYSLVFILASYIYLLSQYNKINSIRPLVLLIVSLAFSYNFYSYFLSLNVLNDNKIKIESKLEKLSKGENIFLGSGYDDSTFLRRQILITSDSLKLFPLPESAVKTLKASRL